MDPKTRRLEGSEGSRSGRVFVTASHALRQPWVARSACLVIACVLLVPEWPWDAAKLVVPALSPYVAIVAAIASRCIGVTALIAVPALLIVLVRRRWLCRYVCPTGLLADLAGRLRGRGTVCGNKLPPIGQWLAWSTVGGALLGYPLFLWLDPLAPFAGFVNAWGRELGRAVWLCAAGLPLILALSLLAPGLWCARICPLGAIQDVLAWPSQRLRSRRTGERGLLWSRPLTRRIVLSGVLGALGAAGIMRRIRGAPSLPLRPPGALSRDQFTALCLRCGSCASVCPSQILHPDLGEFGAESFLTPLVRYEDAYCLETCRRCMRVCPSGALRRLAAEDKRRAVIGLPRVDMDVCLLGEEHECGICRNACPYEAIRIVFSEETYISTPAINRDRCNGCGACQVRCPTRPVKAIVVYPAVL